MVSRIMGLIQQRQFPAAHREIHRHGQDAIGPNWELLELVDDERLIRIIHQSDNAEQWVVAARLLKCKALVLRSAGDAQRAEFFERRAMRIADQIIREPDVNVQLIASLLNEAGFYQMEEDGKKSSEKD